MSVRAVVFDFGGVLFDWNPEYLYRDLIPDARERAWFLQHVCNGDWNLQQDAGRTLADATAAKIAEFPEHAELIRAFYDRWAVMLNGTLADGVQLMEDLEAAAIPLYGSPTGRPRRFRMRGKTIRCCIGSRTLWCPAASS